MLLFQGNRCFLCDEPIPDGEASIEHLVASSRGGSSGDDNCIVCCKAVNEALGHKPFKEKLRVILSHRPRFRCPRHASPSPETAIAVSTSAELAETKLAVTVRALRRLRTSRPRKVATLRNTISNAFERLVSEQEIDTLIEELVAANHIVINEQKVSYNLPAVLSRAELMVDGGASRPGGTI